MKSQEVTMGFLEICPRDVYPVSESFFFLHYLKGTLELWISSAEVTRLLGALWLHDRLHFVILQIEFWKGGCLVINGITLIEVLQFHHPTM